MMVQSSYVLSAGRPTVEALLGWADQDHAQALSNCEILLVISPVEVV